MGVLEATEFDIESACGFEFQRIETQQLTLRAVWHNGKLATLEVTPGGRT